MTSEGASQRDLYTFLFVPKDDFVSWFSHGRDLVNQEYGRSDEDRLKELIADDTLDKFDVLCLLLYRGVMTERWKVKREMHKLVGQSNNPQLAFKYLESVYAAEYNPKYADPDRDMDDEDADESATSFVMEQFFQQSQHHADAEQEQTVDSGDDAKTVNTSSDESLTETQES